MLIKHAGSYREIYDAFRWNVPQRFNIATACCDRWAADPDRVALIHEQPDGQVRRYTFAELRELSNRCANMLVGLGLQRNDRVLLLLGQRPETAILHLARGHDQRALLGAVRRRCGLLPGADIRREGRHHGRRQPGQGDRSGRRCPGALRRRRARGSRRLLGTAA